MLVTQSLLRKKRVEHYTFGAWKRLETCWYSMTTTCVPVFVECVCTKQNSRKYKGGKCHDESQCVEPHS